ncbi:MAG: TIGR01777 family oxidoreductase [Ferruginibacter sp.]
MQTVLISGGTGFTGKHLTKILLQKGYRVIVLSRDAHSREPVSNMRYAHWDISKQEIDKTAISDADHIIHLAGAGVMDRRWSKKYMAEIADSRTRSASLLVNSLKTTTHKVQSFISASAIGWYGADTNSTAFTEEAPASPGFLGETCRVWEAAADEATTLGIRVCKLRTGIVLGKGGGAFEKYSKPVKYGLVPIMSSGKQVMSWIHLDDICRMYLFGIENNQLQGNFNAVATVPESNRSFMLKLAKQMRGNRFIAFHIPAFALKLGLGKSSIEILKSCTVSNSKIKAAGFTFIYPTAEAALAELCRPL